MLCPVGISDLRNKQGCGGSRRLCSSPWLVCCCPGFKLGYVVFRRAIITAVIRDRLSSSSPDELGEEASAVTHLDSAEDGSDLFTVSGCVLSVCKVQAGELSSAWSWMLWERPRKAEVWEQLCHGGGPRETGGHQGACWAEVFFFFPHVYQQQSAPSC